MTGGAHRPPESADAELRVVDRLLAANRVEDARGHCAALAAKFPQDAVPWIRLGQCLLRLGRRAEALDAAGHALRTGPPGAPWLDALGTLLTHLEEPLQALPLFQRAVALAPDSIDLRYNLAMAQRMAGALQEAEENLDIVIAARPDDGEAQHARSNLRRQTAGRNHVGELERTLQRLQGRRPSVPVAFALAKELEDLGEYPRAFALLERASRAYRASLRYDVADDVAVLDRLRQTQTRPVIDGLTVPFANDEAIFIIGLPRSGTTLVEGILGSHTQVHAAGELDAFPTTAVAAVARSGTPASKLDFAARILGVDFARLGPDYLAATRPRTGHTPRFTDKLPFNYLYAGVIHAALPRARFIAVQREPMDSLYAMYKTLFASAYPFTYDLEDLGRYYVAWQRLMTHWRDVIGAAWLDVRYESLVSDQEGISRQIVAHCGLAWEPGCLRFHARTGGVTTASAAQVRQPLYADSVGKWRHYAAQLAPLAARLEADGISPCAGTPPSA